jgi:hypothetical protein
MRLKKEWTKIWAIRPHGARWDIVREAGALEEFVSTHTTYKAAWNKRLRMLEALRRLEATVR